MGGDLTHDSYSTTQASKVKGQTVVILDDSLTKRAYWQVSNYLDCVAQILESFDTHLFAMHVCFIKQCDSSGIFEI